MEHIPIDRELEAFKGHIVLNPRTVFSAKFGDGKTTFLNEFRERYQDEFYFITLYPINYSVADNADIFEYIKRDILLQLANDNKLNDIDFDAISQTIFNWENFKEVINFILSFTPMGSEIFKKVTGFAESFHKKYEEKQHTFSKYKDLFTGAKGSIYEEDAYTQLIQSTLKYIQNDLHHPKECVLIIEDLDRIDPGHLFRILNVLGAHMDNHNEQINKFGFDYIVTVFDYVTTKHIFHHFYGQDANYQGYINKFISVNPFNFSILEVARNNFYSFIREKCLLNKDDLESTKKIPPELNFNLVKYINSLSIREITNITTDIDKQISKEEFQTLPSREHFKTKQPILYFLAILKRMNVPCENSVISSYLGSTKELFHILHGFLLMDKQMTSAHLFNFRGNTYKVTKIQHENFFDLNIQFVDSTIGINTRKEKYVQEAIYNAVTICNKLIK